MTDYDWTYFDVHFYIEAPIEDIYRMWATPRGMEAFFVETMKYASPDGTQRGPDDFAQEGDSYDWVWIHKNALAGEVKEANGKDRFAFTFGESLVTIELKPTVSGTQVHLRQSDIPDTPEAHAQWHLSCRCGWIYFMGILKSVLEHDIDPRDRNPVTAMHLSINYVPEQAIFDIAAPAEAARA